ncbi:protein phosphatase 1 regulatory subunit 1A [Fukomys damarensis]|uniref:protein phosphatase 1 regulatory subunit 1A n=1 Tax=Fukomys damarensis TaxID=885580 RepID=UPI0008FF63D6|nr:protein phosphatase 1 regulatory subunit 1A [Fukomys damarensis]
MTLGPEVVAVQGLGSKLRDLQGTLPKAEVEEDACVSLPSLAWGECHLWTSKIRRRRPTPATLVLTSDQSSPEVDEDRIPNPLLKSTLAMSPHQRKKMTRATPTMKELQTMVEHHLGQQKQGEEPEGAAESTGTQESCPPGISDTGAESRLGTPGTAQQFAGLSPKTQERSSEEPSTEDPSIHIPPLDSQGANSV